VSQTPKLPWADDVDDDHYSDAYDYLSLHWLPAQAGPAVQALREAPVVKYHPGDLLRAANLQPVGLDDAGVRREIAKAIADGHFQPALVVNLQHGVVVADGLHRLSAALHLAPFQKARIKLGPSPKDAFEDAPER
jgi:hypothetical protein